MKQYPFLQKIQYRDEELAIEDVLSVAYIEMMDIGGTKLILTLADQASYYQDTLKIGRDSQLTLTFSDLSGGDEQLWTETFIVVVPSRPDNGQALKLECFQSACYDLKQLATHPIFINNAKPNQALSRLLPGATINTDSFNALGTYHLNAGATKSKLIRNLARDYGAEAFYCRGQFFLYDMRKRMTSKPDFLLEYSNPQAQFQINSYQQLGQTALYQRVLNKKYIRWDTVHGLQTSTVQGDAVTTLISCPSQAALNAQSIAMIPTLNAELVGFGGFKPGLLCELAFHKRDPDNQLDESIPRLAAILQVTHYQRGYHYVCKLVLGVINAY